jgi:hypothetical protein
MSPPLSSRSRSSSLDSAFDEEYFSKTYVPLSNLPTPPTSSHSNVLGVTQDIGDVLLYRENLDPDLIGMHTFLCLEQEDGVGPIPCYAWQYTWEIQIWQTSVCHAVLEDTALKRGVVSTSIVIQFVQNAP